MALNIQESLHSHSYWCVCAPGKQRQTDKMIDGERKEMSGYTHRSQLSIIVNVAFSAPSQLVHTPN